MGNTGVSPECLARESGENRKRRAPKFQACAVVRHSIRADCEFETAASWWNSPESLRWPTDPPLTQAGIELARATATSLLEALRQQTDNDPQEDAVVVSSPYFRCVQTAVEIAAIFKVNTPILVDLEAGEVFGPPIMPAAMPAQSHRLMAVSVEYAKARGVELYSTYSGTAPNWPESLQGARRRYVCRFLALLKRSLKVKRNVILVSHAEAVSSTLSVFPPSACLVDRVAYCGNFIATRRLHPDCTQPAPIISEDSEMKSQSPISEPQSDPELLKDLSLGGYSDMRSPTQPFGTWTVKTTGIDTRKVDNPFPRPRSFSGISSSDMMWQKLEKTLGDLPMIEERDMNTLQPYEGPFCSLNIGDDLSPTVAAFTQPTSPFSSTLHSPTSNGGVTKQPSKVNKAEEIGKQTKLAIGNSPLLARRRQMQLDKLASRNEDDATESGSLLDLAAWADPEEAAMIARVEARILPDGFEQAPLPDLPPSRVATIKEAEHNNLMP